MAALPASFLAQPFAHRGLHDQGLTCVENSVEAVQRACALGVGIELDLQLSADGVAMMFHDAHLDRLTFETGPVSACTAWELAEIGLKDGSPIPTLSDILKQIAGQVPLLLELKDQSGRMAGSDGRLEEAVLRAIRTYDGPLAAMSFNPDQIACLLARGFAQPVGLVTGSLVDYHADIINPERRAALHRVTPAFKLPLAFLSHNHSDTTHPALSIARQSGLSLLCWTTRDLPDAKRAYQHFDQVTFEGDLPRHSA